jgi:hypothetical protein
MRKIAGDDCYTCGQPLGDTISRTHCAACLAIVQDTNDDIQAALAKREARLIARTPERSVLSIAQEEAGKPGTIAPQPGVLDKIKSTLTGKRAARERAQRVATAKATSMTLMLGWGVEPACVDDVYVRWVTYMNDEAVVSDTWIVMLRQACPHLFRIEFRPKSQGKPTIEPLLPLEPQPPTPLTKGRRFIDIAEEE